MIHVNVPTRSRGEGVKSLGYPWTELQLVILRNVIELAEDS